MGNFSESKFGKTYFGAKGADESRFDLAVRQNQRAFESSFDDAENQLLKAQAQKAAAIGVIAPTKDSPSTKIINVNSYLEACQTVEAAEDTQQALKDAYQELFGVEMNR